MQAATPFPRPACVPLPYSSTEFLVSITGQLYSICSYVHLCISYIFIMFIFVWVLCCAGGSVRHERRPARDHLPDAWQRRLATRHPSVPATLCSSHPRRSGQATTGARNKGWLIARQCAHSTQPLNH